MSETQDEVRAATLKLVGDYQSLLTAQRWEEWGAPWAEDGVLDFPFAPDGRQRLYRGRKAWTAGFGLADGAP